MPLFHQLVSRRVDFSDPVLLIAELLEELVELSLQHLDVLQVLPELLRRNECFL